MGSAGSKLKGEAVPDLTAPPSKTDSPPSKHSGDLNTPDEHRTKDFVSTYGHNLGQGALPQHKTGSPATPQPAAGDNTNKQPRRQSLMQRWKERKGVPEPKDGNGRGLYTGKTTEELVKQARSQVIDGRVGAAAAMGSGS